MIPSPPTHLQMPDAELAFTIIWGILAAGALVHAIWHSQRKRSALPIAIIVGSTLAMGCEPLVIHYMHTWYPAIGQINAFNAFDQSIPLFVALAYVFFFAPGVLMLMDAIERGITPKQWWLCYLGAIVGVIAYESAGLSVGLWSYYGIKPLLIGKLPMAWTFINSALIMMPAAVLYRLRHHIVGWRVLLVIPFMAAQVAGMEMFIGYPLYLAINSDVSLAVATVAAFASIAIAIATVWVCGQLVCKDSHKEAPILQ